MRTGVFGGTFNPIHNGHIRLARTYAAALGLERMLVVPTRLPPHKTDAGLIDGALRLEMCRIAFAQDPFFEVSGIELQRQDKSYTVKTLEQFRESFPDDVFYLIMGSDMFLTLTTWFRWQRLFELAVICAGGREPGLWARLSEQKQRLELLGAHCELVDLDPVPVSSTEIRRRVAAGLSISGLVPAMVEGYIQENGLYRLPDSPGR